MLTYNPITAKRLIDTLDSENLKLSGCALTPIERDRLIATLNNLFITITTCTPPFNHDAPTSEANE